MKQKKGVLILLCTVLCLSICMCIVLMEPSEPAPETKAKLSDLPRETLIQVLVEYGLELPTHPALDDYDYNRSAALYEEDPDRIITVDWIETDRLERSIRKAVNNYYFG